MVYNEAKPMIRIKEISSDTEMQTALKIRRAVFCEEQKVPEQEEFDGLDHTCRQYLAFRNGKPIGTARLRIESSNKTKIERVAVLAKERGKGAGHALMKRTIGDAEGDGECIIAIHAQCHAQKFYEDMGFAQIG